MFEKIKECCFTIRFIKNILSIKNMHFYEHKVVEKPFKIPKMCYTLNLKHYRFSRTI